MELITPFSYDPGGPNYTWTRMRTLNHDLTAINIAEAMFRQLGFAVGLAYAMIYIPALNVNKHVAVWSGATVSTIASNIASRFLSKHPIVYATTVESYTVTPQNETIVQLATAVYSDKERKNLLYQNWSYLK